MAKYRIFWPVFLCATAALIFGLSVPDSWGKGDDGDELPLGAAVFIIETTVDDIELQAFIDGSPGWNKFQISDPGDKKLFGIKTRRRLKKQGLSELFFASQPDHFAEDVPSDAADEAVLKFLRNFREGEYEFEAQTTDGRELGGDAVFTHVIPALPEIIAPVSDTDDPPVVDPNNLVIEWEPVTTRFLGEGPVTIIEYQVILDQGDPLRETAWVDGETRRAVINLPGTATRLTVPPEYLLPGASYEFEILAIEESGNPTISAGEFDTAE